MTFARACLGALALGLAACSSPEPARAPVTEVEIPVATDPDVAEPAAPVAVTHGVAPGALEALGTEPPPDIGWASLPALPSAAALAINRSGLVHHRHERYERATEAFRRALSLAPDYAMARFNLACALTRLGAEEEAAILIRSLLASELPVFGPRYDRDEDLSSLRQGEFADSIAEHRRRVNASYRTLIPEGVPVAYARRSDASGTDRPPQVIRQAGLWVSERDLFLPMGPSISTDERSGHFDRIGTHYYASHNRVLTCAIHETMTDEPSFWGLKAGAYSAPDGAEIGRVRVPDPDPSVDVAYRFSVQLTAQGARWETNLARGLLGPPGGTIGDAPAPCHHGGLSVEGVEIPGHRQVLLGEGDDARAVALSPWHRHELFLEPILDYLTIGMDVGPQSLLVLTTSNTETGLDGAIDGPYALSRIDRRTGSAEVLAHGRGVVSARRGPDGSVYVEMPAPERSFPAVVHRHTPDGRSVELPEGLILSP